MSDDLYEKIRIATLRGDVPIGFDLFVRIGERFVIYCRRGTTFDGERLARLQNKKLKDLYVERTARVAYDQYINESLAVSERGDRDPAVRGEIVAGLQQAAAEVVMENPTDEVTYVGLRDKSLRFVQMIADEPLVVGAILRVANVNRSVAQHAVNVAALATAMLIKQHGSPGPKAQLLVLGCLLHDVDHYRAGRDVGARPAELSAAARDDYLSHPNRGARLFQTSTFIDQLVIQIISQHEETMDGTGYPRHLTADEMDPLVMTAGVANAYDRLVSFDRLNPREALKCLLLDKLGEYPLDLLQTLQAVLKLNALV